ncbi:MAG: hypothetical protein WB868_16300 [Xanthobacteraceae bacterium]
METGTLEYLKDLAHELAVLAGANGHVTLAYIFAMAEKEAADALAAASPLAAE